MEIELTTEEKIKLAARRIFLQKGFAATRTRDIADEAGINLALLNYYFRSKEKLFEMVMQECLTEFFSGLIAVLNDKHTSIVNKIDTIVNSYLDLLLDSPNLPIFILSSMQTDPDKFFEKTHTPSSFILDSVFYQQLANRLKELGTPDINPFHFVLNVLALSVFPFIMKPVVKNTLSVDDEHFCEFIEQRRSLVPVWVKAMLKLDE